MAGSMGPEDAELAALETGSFIKVAGVAGDGFPDGAVANAAVALLF